MRIYIPIFIITLILLAGLGQAQLGVPNLKITQVKYDPFPAESGSYFKLFLRVENTGQAEADNVECELVPKYPFSLDPNEYTIREIGRLPQSEHAVIEYMIRVDADAVNGDNELSIKCSSDGLESGSSITKKLTVNVKASNPEPVIGMIKSTPSQIRPGMEEVKLVAEIQNIGEGDTKLTIVEVVLPKGMSPSTSYSNINNLGTIPKDSSKEATFYIDIDKSITPDLYHVPMHVKYKIGNNPEQIDKRLLLEINVRPAPIFVVEEFRAGTNTGSDSFTGYVVRSEKVISPSSISQAGTGELRIILRNAGEEEARSVSVRIFKDTTQPFEFDEIYDFIGNMKPNETGEVVFAFSVDENAVLKKYFMEIEMRYLEGNDVKTDRDTVSIEVSNPAPPNLLIYIPIIIVIILVAFFLIRRRK